MQNNSLKPDASIAGWRALESLPLALFGGVMGLTGLSVAWRLAHVRFEVPMFISISVGGFAVIAFVMVAVGYAVKVSIAPDKVQAELRHPTAGTMFGTLLVSLLLLPLVLAPVCLALAQTMWAIGALGMLVFALSIVSRWINNRQEIVHATPAWIVPVVGLLDVPLAVPLLNLPPMHGVMVLGLSVGLFFAVPLFTIIFSRLVFGPPMADALQPSLMILVAPFSVGFSAYVSTVGKVDLFAEALYVTTLFLLVVLVGRLRYLPICCPFRVSWWAVSFPLAASAIAALRFAQAEPGWLTDAIALMLLAFATVTIVWLLIRTLAGIALGELRTLSS
ncbi:SLAC1 anion channel family protein [Mesorhizobium sp. M0134]|uniref:SLAC1 anion channel family protein n=1 Tax=Mesorhizobium sp. M0134 TaxID=2956889 RepID=UPI00333A4EC7